MFSSASANFPLPIPRLHIHKAILSIPTSTPFLYTSVIFYLPIFWYSHPFNLHKKQFVYLNHLANTRYVKGPMS